MSSAIVSMSFSWLDHLKWKHFTSKFDLASLREYFETLVKLNVQQDHLDRNSLLEYLILDTTSITHTVGRGMWYHSEVVGFQRAGHNLVDEKKTVFLSPLVFDERIHESEWT